LFVARFGLFFSKNRRREQLFSNNSIAFFQKMEKPTYKDLLEAGVHFGHLRRKWNPKMSPYIFMEHKGIHIIDLHRTGEGLEKAANAAKTMAKAGKKILFVATKKQARDIVQRAATSVNMPFVTERWLGGMMTNFQTIRKSIKKMHNIERMLADTTLTSLTKKERLTLERERNKLERQLGGIADMNKIPAAVFLVDIKHEHLALAESKSLGLKTFGMVDTNSDPTKVDFAIPSNDDASKSIAIITNYMVSAIKDGLAEREAAKSATTKE
jgi:small subunit ribosomal protein S2